MHFSEGQLSCHSLLEARLLVQSVLVQQWPRHRTGQQVAGTTLRARGASGRSPHGSSVLVVAGEKEKTRVQNQLWVLHRSRWGREISYHFAGKLQKLQDRGVLTICKWTEIFYSHRYRPIFSNLAVYRHIQTVCSSEALSLQGKFTISNTKASSISINISKHCIRTRGLGILDNKYG